MCLIISKPAGVQFDEKFILGTYNKNKDGIGIMYAENNVLYSAKIAPKNFAEVKAFWDTHVLTDRECVVHFRMQTHGPVETKNAHPFVVLGSEDGYPLQLIHNGILHTDNLEDVSQTDTALYIKNYLRPMLLKNPEFFLTPAFAEIIGEHIGRGNRFVLLDAYGNRVTINEDTGVTHNGAWLSNTYAWDTTGSAHGRTSYASKGWLPYYDTDDFWKEKGVTYAKPALVTPIDDADELAESDFFYDTLMDALVDARMYKAERSVRYSEVAAYLEQYGNDAWTLLDMLENNAYTEDELLEELRRVETL